MISEMAMADIEQLEELGVRLDPRETVRLNALGVKAERHPDASSFFSVRRCAFVGDLVLKEPTIGHALWFDRAVSRFDEEDEQTYFALRVLMLSKELDDLPPPEYPKQVQAELQAFAKKEISDCTVRQLVSAVNYVETGSDPDSGETPPAKERGEEMPEGEFSAQAGVVREAQALGLGISTKDANAMTHSQLQAVIQRAYEINGIEVDKQLKQRAIGDYYATLQEIKEKYKV